MSSFINLSGDVPVFQKVFFRNFFALFIAVAALLKNRESFKPAKDCIKFHILRSSAGLVGMLDNFYATTKMSSTADAAILNKMSPFFTLIFSAIFLKEKVKPKQALAIAVVFAGAMLVIKPTISNAELLPSLVGFMGGVCAGGAYTCVRYMGGKGENGRFTVFFFSLFSTVALAPYLIADFTPMTAKQWLYLVFVGISAAGGQFGITAAYTFAPSREISVYDYSNVIFTAVSGYFFLGGQVPDLWSFAGYFIICSMAVWMFIYNNREYKLNN